MRRYVPTTLYIDTQIFVRNGFRLDTKDFSALKSTFAKGDIRLLIPEMMERELFRKYRERANKVAEEFLKSSQVYPINDLHLGNFPDKKKLLEECYSQLEKKWEQFKKHFTVEPLPIVGNLDDVVNWYFEINPPFSKEKPKEFPDAFILSALESYHKRYHARIAIVSGDGDFKRFCLSQQYIDYYEDLQKYAQAFKPELERKPQFIDPTIPIVTEDLNEIKSILDRGKNVTKIEINRVIILLKNYGQNYRYFFKNAHDAVWIEPLNRHKFFKYRPNIRSIDDSRFQHPFWYPIIYLVKVFDSAPEKVLDILERLPDTKNHSILEGVFDVVLKSDSPSVLERLSPKVMAFIDCGSWHHNKIIELLKKPYFFKNRLGLASSLLSLSIEFLPDIESSEKHALWKENPENYWASLLTPAPRFGSYQYQEILNKGVRPLAERQPFHVARTLVDAVATMIRLHKHEVDVDDEQDISEVWCRRLGSTRSNHPDSRETLIQTLVVACQEVFEKLPTSIVALDSALRNQRWHVFKRLRQHLYALYPNEQTKPWIRELILAYTDYAQDKYHYELQQTIKHACEHFKVKLLTEEERTKIFDEIISGPSKKEFRDRLTWWGKNFTEDAFRKRQRIFHRLQLRPFASVLFGKYSIYYRELENELGESVSDEDYSPVGKITGGSVSFRSPTSSEELSNLSDKKLLDYINSWQNIHHEDEEGDSLIEINIQALAGEFGNIFKESIIPSENRLNFWLENRDHIQRPVYVRAMVDAMQKCVEEKDLKRIDLWLDFCKWVITHPDQKHQDGTRFGDESREDPNWHTSRRAVGDFVEACLKQDVGTPISVRDKLADILHKLCTQIDWHLSEGELVVRNDPLTDAINTIRGRALESLIKFGFWVRRNSEKPEVPEISTILDMRLDQNAEHPLTSPEYAILGLHYCHIVMFNREWAQSHKVDFFPQNTRSAWRASFGAFIKYGGPSDQAFNEIKSEYIFALQHLAWFSHGPQEQKDSINEFVSRLGQHLLNYYLWGMYPLKGKTSLLEILYKRTKDNPDHWKNLFHYAGYSLQHTGTQLNEELKNRIIEFFNWRLAVKEPRELEKFVLWLEAECLSAEWRLNALSEVLDVPKTEVKGFLSRLSGLTKMLEDHPEKVVECFANMTDKISKNNRVYINYDEGKKILSAGLTSSDENTHAHAERALDKLLRSGHFDFTQLVK